MSGIIGPKEELFPNPSYPLPGIASGFPVMDASDSPSGNMCQTENNRQDDLINKLEGLSALTYAFMLPSENGALIFNDPWADLSSQVITSCWRNRFLAGDDTLGMSRLGSGRYGQFDAFLKLIKI